MGLNSYNSYNKLWVDKYTDRLNDAQATEAEVHLRENTANLETTMNPMIGVEKQEIGRMEIETGEAHKIMSTMRDLARQHPDTPARALDIGTFTGHSAGALARGMEFGGEVITMEKEFEDGKEKPYLEVAHKYWQEEGVADKIVSRATKGGANEVLDELLADEKNHNSFDMVFIDADKIGYQNYLEKSLKLLRPGGKIMLDNMLWSGRTTDNYIAAEKALETHKPVGAEPISMRVDNAGKLIIEDGPVSQIDPKNSGITSIALAAAGKEDQSQQELRKLNDYIVALTRGPNPEIEFEFDNACDGIMVVEKKGFVKKYEEEKNLVRHYPSHTLE